MNVTQMVPFIDSFNSFQHHAAIGDNIGIVAMAQEPIALGDFLLRIDIDPLSAAMTHWAWLGGNDVFNQLVHFWLYPVVSCETREADDSATFIVLHLAAALHVLTAYCTLSSLCHGLDLNSSCWCLFWQVSSRWMGHGLTALCIDKVMSATTIWTGPILPCKEAI